MRTVSTHGAQGRSRFVPGSQRQRLVPLRRRIQERPTFRSQCSHNQVLSGLLGSGRRHTFLFVAFREKNSKQPFLCLVRIQTEGSLFPFSFPSLSPNSHRLRKEPSDNNRNEQHADKHKNIWRNSKKPTLTNKVTLIMVINQRPRA